MPPRNSRAKKQFGYTVGGGDDPFAKYSGAPLSIEAQSSGSQADPFAQYASSGPQFSAPSPQPASPKVAGLEGLIDSKFLKTRNSLKSHRTAGNAPKYQAKKKLIEGFFGKKDDDTSLDNRIINTAKDTYGAFKEGIQNVAAGQIEKKYSNENLEQIAFMKNKIKKDFEKTGDKDRYDRAMELMKKFTGKTFDDMTLSNSKQVRGAARMFGSPVEGIITGGFKPEVEKLTKRISKGVGGMKPENQQKLQDAIAKITELSKDHPALTNYLAAGTEFLGVGGGSKLAKETSGKALEVLSKAAPSVDKAAKFTLDKSGDIMATLAGKAAKTGSDMITNLNKKLRAPSNKNLKAAEELLRDLPTTSNLREGAKKGLTDLGVKNWFKGKKDTVRLSPKLKEAQFTLASKIGNLDKVSPAALPVKIDSVISSIANPLKEIFKTILVVPKVKKAISEGWDVLKKKQSGRYESRKFLSEMQKTFETDYINKIFRKFKDESGKFRTASADDFWDMSKSYDNQYENLIKAVEKGSTDPKVLSQFEAFLENRELIRDMMKNLAEEMTDVKVRNAFKEMADLYLSKNQILKNIRPTNVSGTSKTTDITKKFLRNYIPAAAVGYGGYQALN